jgi:hypothetical protein
MFVLTDVLGLCAQLILAGHPFEGIPAPQVDLSRQEHERKQSALSAELHELKPSALQVRYYLPLCHLSVDFESNALPIYACHWRVH